MPKSAPPGHLSRSAKTVWREVLGSYDLEVGHLRLLQAALEAWDRVLLSAPQGPHLDRER